MAPSTSTLFWSRVDGTYVQWQHISPSPNTLLLDTIRYESHFSINFSLRLIEPFPLVNNRPHLCGNTTTSLWCATLLPLTHNPHFIFISPYTFQVYYSYHHLQSRPQLQCQSLYVPSLFRAFHPPLPGFSCT